MRIWEDEATTLFRATVRGFIKREIAPTLDRWARQGQVDRTIWLKAAELGLLCPAISTDFGGGGGDIRHDVVFQEELARNSALGFGNNVHSAIDAHYLAAYGSASQKSYWLPRLSSGEAIGAIAMTEPRAGSDLAAISTKAKKVAEGWLLNGTKTYISNGGTADLFIVAAKLDAADGSSGISLFLVSSAASGFSRGPKLRKIGLDAQDTAEIYFDDVHLSHDALLGDLGAGLSQLKEQLPRERLILAAEAVAAAEDALERTVAQVTERHAFGVPLAHQQNTRFVLADCYGSIRTTKSFVDELICDQLNGRLTAENAALAKYWATEMLCTVVDRCLQLHGGSGYMRENPVAQHYLDARVTRIAGGANEVLKEVVARVLIGTVPRHRSWTSY